MDRLTSLEVFSRVVETGGFSAAARKLNMSTTMVSNHVQALEDRLGSVAPGREADLVVLDPKATPLLALRNERAESIEDVLFALMMLGDDRAVAATYVAGTRAHIRDM